MALEARFSGFILRIGAVVVAKVTSMRREGSAETVDVTGTEDVTGSLVQEQLIPVQIGENVQLEGVAKGAAAAWHEPGQTAMLVAFRAGDDTITIDCEYVTGYGETYTGFFSAYSEGAANVNEVFRWSGTFHINAIAVITP